MSQNTIDRTSLNHLRFKRVHEANLTSESPKVSESGRDPVDVAEISEASRSSTGQKLAKAGKVLLAVGAGVALAAASLPIAVGAAAGAVLAGGAVYLKETFSRAFSLGLGGMPKEAVLEKTMKAARVGAGMGAAAGGILSGNGLLITGVAVGGLTAFGLVRAAKKRLNPLNWA